MTFLDIILNQPIANALILLYRYLGGGLGVSIIALTILIRILLLPIVLPSMRSTQKMQSLKPELDKLKEKYGNDKQGLAQAQLELYKQHNINPVAGLLPMIVQIAVLFSLFHVLSIILKGHGGAIAEFNSILYPFNQLAKDTKLQTQFLYLNITKPDTIALPFTLNLGLFKLGSLPGPLLILAAFSQWWSSKLMMTSGKSSTPRVEVKNNQAQDDMATTMQTQMMYMAPAMTLLIGLQFPSGLVLYWVTFSLVLVVQQLMLNYQAKKVNKNI